MTALIVTVQPVVIEPIGMERLFIEAHDMYSDLTARRSIANQILKFEEMLDTIANLQSATPAEKLAAQILLKSTSRALNFISADYSNG